MTTNRGEFDELREFFRQRGIASTEMLDPNPLDRDDQTIKSMFSTSGMVFYRWNKKIANFDIYVLEKYQDMSRIKQVVRNTSIMEFIDMVLAGTVTVPEAKRR